MGAVLVGGQDILYMIFLLQVGMAIPRIALPSDRADTVRSRDAQLGIKPYSVCSSQHQ